jgi:hypothetical protein
MHVSILVANQVECLMKVKVSIGGTAVRSGVSRGAGASSADTDFFEVFEQEHVCWDPKDGELCLSRVKLGETLVEVCSDFNV